MRAPRLFSRFFRLAKLRAIQLIPNHPMGRHHHSRKNETLRTVFFCILFAVGLMAGIGALFWYWDRNDFVPDARPGNPVESKP
jgi:hypothetical protein